MALELIGNEEFPNLYIKSILVIDRQVRITTAFYDYIDSEGFPTYLTDNFLDEQHVNLNVILSRQGSDVSAALESGSDYSLYEIKKTIKKSTIYLPADDNDNDRLYEYRLGIKKSVIKDKISNAEPDSYIEINDVVAFGIDENIDFLSVFSTLKCYAFFSFDVDKEADNYYLDITDPKDEKMLHGPIFSETIVSNGRLKNKTTEFTIDGLGYPGPVHRHDGGFMEGSQHRSEAHRDVETRVVPNYKLEYFREPSAQLKIDKAFVSSWPSSRYFTPPMISVARKSIYGFFKFKTDAFFADLENYKYFRGSTIKFNVFKVRENIRLEINGSKVTSLKEITVNHKSDNDMYFYFTKNFDFYEPTVFDFKLNILSPNNLIVNTIREIYDDSKLAIQRIRNLSESSPGLYVRNVNSIEILDFIRKYISVVSILRDLNQVELQNLKQMCVQSLYKPEFSKEIFSLFQTNFGNHMAKLNNLVESLTQQPDQSVVQQIEIPINLANYQSAINYLGPRRLCHPDTIFEFIRKTNGEVSGGDTRLFQTREQLLLPASVRNYNTDKLVDINYSDVLKNVGLVFSDTRRADNDLEEIDTSTKYGEHVAEQQIQPFASNTNANTSLSENTTATGTGLGVASFNQAQEEEAQEIANQAQEAVAAATGISISGDDIVPCGDVRRDIYDADGNYVRTVTDYGVDCDFDGVADSPRDSTVTRAEKLAALNNNGGS